MCEHCLPQQGLSRRALLGAAGAGALALMTGTPRMAAASAPSIAVAPGLDIWPRSAWADGRPPLGPIEQEDVRFLLVHHTASSNSYSESGAIDIMRGAYDLHTGPDKGWPDVAYNFFVDRFGRVFEARAGSIDGAVVADATGGSQGFAQLVCIIGNFTSEMPSASALSSAGRVLAWMADRFEIDTRPGSTVDFVSRGSNLWPVGTPVVARVRSPDTAI